jgi:hypothetical protein
MFWSRILLTTLRFSNSFIAVERKSIDGIEVLGPASNILYSIRSEDYYFNLNLNNLLFMATVPFQICFCASGATGHLVS